MKIIILRLGYGNFFLKRKLFFRFYLTKAEFCGLTLDDIDMKNRKIRIDHQLQRTRDGVYLVVDTKTTYGERILPMGDDVYECFQNMIKKRRRVGKEPVVDGKKGVSGTGCERHAVSGEPLGETVPVCVAQV